MGEYSIFECGACGYKSGRIRWGVGEKNQRIRFLPAVCQHCQELVEVDLTDSDVMFDEFSCEKCDRPVFFFEHSESFACPRCNAPNMSIKQEGYW